MVDLKALPEPKVYFSLSGKGFTEQPFYSNPLPLMLKSCGRQTLSLSRFFRLTPAHIGVMLAQPKKGGEALSGFTVCIPPLKKGVLDGVNL